MKKQNIIYGVAGMLEYQALIKVGSAKMKIPFTNGSTNESGRTPATFSTSNPIIQLAIENSKEFKCGLIRRVHAVNTDEEVYIESEHVALQGNEPENTSDETGSNEIPNEPVKEVADVPNEAEQVHHNAEEVPTQTDAETIETSTRKEFACNDDAKDFFETEFGVKRSTLRTRADIIAYGKNNGIDVVFTD